MLLTAAAWRFPCGATSGTSVGIGLTGRSARRTFALQAATAAATLGPWLRVGRGRADVAMRTRRRNREAAVAACRAASSMPWATEEPLRGMLGQSQAELMVRIDAMRSAEKLAAQLAPLPPSRALQELELAISQCRATQHEEMEGHCAPEQLDFLRSFVAQRFHGADDAAEPIRMCQVGFNAGHSAMALMEHAPGGSALLSLDLGNHSYTRPLERVVQRLASERGQTHILLEGDSAEMLPRFRHIDFDLVFIDGNHAYEAVKMDFLNCTLLASERTTLLLNHVFTDMLEGVGPTRVWLEALEEGSVEQRGWFSCCSRHGIAIGAVSHRQQG